MPKMIVSEKTLELNIGAEILNVIRGQPGCGAAFWIGMRQDQEAKSGIDELIQNVPTSVHLALQFKAPRPTPPNGPYRFTINDRQHGHLARLADTRPNAVHYVLPHYNRFGTIRAAAASKNGLLASTYFLALSLVKDLPPAANKAGTHTVQSDPPSAVIHSQSADVRMMSAVIFRELVGVSVTGQVLAKP